MRASLLGLLALFACGEGDSGPFDVARMNANAAALVEAGYAETVDALGTLTGAAEAFCAAAPTVSQYEALVAQLTATRSTFKRAEVFAFGPYTDSPWRVGPDLDRWPVDPPRIIALLEGDTELTDGDVLELFGAGLKGFPAFEFLLHGRDETTRFATSDEAVAAFASAPRRCAYLRVALENFATRLADLRAAWSLEGDRYVLELSDPGSTERDIYEDPFEAASALYEQLVFTIENVQQLKIGKPLGLRTSGRPEPDSAEARFSQTSALLSSATLAGVRVLYDGGDGPGIGDWIASRDPALEAQVASAFDAAATSLAGLEGRPLNDRIADEPEVVRAAYDALRSLRQLLAVDAAGLLAVSVTFNPTDGD